MRLGFCNKLGLLGCQAINVDEVANEENIFRPQAKAIVSRVNCEPIGNNNM